MVSASIVLKAAVRPRPFKTRRHEFTARTHAWIRLLTNDKVWRKSGSLERTTPPQVAPVFQKSYDYCLEGPRGGATSKDRGGGQGGARRGAAPARGGAARAARRGGGGQPPPEGDPALGRGADAAG